VAVNDSANNLVNQPARSEKAHGVSVGALVKDYLLLTKPRVIRNAMCFFAARGLIY